MLQGCDPVRATLKFVLNPAQMVVAPLNTLVGIGLTVTVGVPVKLVPAQLTSATAVIE